MQFQDELAAGVTLVRPALQSPDYVAGASGWSIKIDGSAEFSDIVIRGSGAGDAVVIGPDGMPQVRIGSNATAGYITFPTNRPIENDVATILAGVNNQGAANESSTLQIYGPTVDGATAQARIFLNSQSNDGSSNASLSLRAGTALMVMDNPAFVVQGPRLRVVPTASALSVVQAEAAAGHTGNLFEGFTNGASQFAVNETGGITASGLTIDSVDQGRGTQDYTASTASTALAIAETVGITSGAVDFEPGRAYRVTLHYQGSGNTAGDCVAFRMRTTNLAGTSLFDSLRTHILNVGGAIVNGETSQIIYNATAATVSTVIVGTVYRMAGAGTVQMFANVSNPVWILVEDIGSTADYPGIKAM
jgi:hypothetical protein